MTFSQHILCFAQTLRGGGVERAMLALARQWCAAGRRVTLLIGDGGGPLAAEVPAAADARMLGDGRYGALPGAIAAAVRADAPDMIFCPGNHYTGAAALARLRLGRGCPPIVAKISNALVRPEMGAIAAWGYRRWLRAHPRFLAHVVAMSPAMAAEAVAELRIAAERVSVIANPPPRPPADAPPVPLPPGRFLLGVGRLEPQKRWDRLIDAMARIADPQVSLLILGEGGARAALEAQVARLGLAARVRMPGYAADPGPALARAEAAVLTSDFEGVPGVLREALALGTPVVATEASVAVREIVDTPDKGEVVPRGDADALLAALERRLAPGAARPEPVAAPGDPAADYLALFDRIAAQRSA
ncbi:glycosyltransferase [Sphingomonas canadensis]|uniref:Glycosyltransferase n=1 Tax=Sphingomonas canadensis TaxID=1219257 RepID=A0ABW3H7T2_9SPHN|nr:glycosyltransferase [Sphingomonas canadensis]MCW3837199.1 glycosyltransferase [Sphingomonas canadensis]